MTLDQYQAYIVKGEQSDGPDPLFHITKSNNF